MDHEFRVMTFSRLRQLGQRARENGLTRYLSPESLSLIDPGSICLARLAAAERCGPLVPHYRAAVVVQLTGVEELSEVVMDVLHEDWHALPTVTEFDAELDLFEAAVSGTR